MKSPKHGYVKNQQAAELYSIEWAIKNAAYTGQQHADMVGDSLTSARTRDCIHIIIGG